MSTTTTEFVEVYGISWEVQVYRGSAAMDDPTTCIILGGTWAESWYEYGEECVHGDAPWWERQPVVGERIHGVIRSWLIGRYGDTLRQRAWEQAREVA